MTFQVLEFVCHVRELLAVELAARASDVRVRPTPGEDTMRKLGGTLLLSIALCAPAIAADAPVPQPPQVGQAAPALRLQDQHGTWHTLEQYRGNWVVLYFYPKDFTRGCTTEVCAFRDDLTALHKLGARVLGVSLDDVASHAEFAKKYQVPFPLLSDADKQVAASCGVLASRLGFTHARRDTFLIDPTGKVARHYENVDPKQNVAQVLTDLAALQAGAH
jgi:peroxiredoxin Q/BCP